jgi:hypothetical protein
MPKAAATDITSPADAKLLALCRQFDTDTRALDRYNALAAIGELPPALDQSYLDRVSVCWHDTLDQIIPLPATTMVGLFAKARALGHALRLASDCDGDVDGQGENYDRLAMSLVRDLARHQPDG